LVFRMERIVLVGGGGHAASVADTLRSTGQFEIIGFTDSSPKADTLLGIPYIGTDDVLSQLFRSGVRSAVVSVGSVGNTNARLGIYQNLKTIGFSLPVIQDPTAIVARNCTIQEGTYLGKGVVVNTGSIIGKMCIINTRSVIEHGGDLGDFVHLAPGVTLGGDVIVGDHTHVGIGSSVIEGRKIGRNCLIGAGSVVIKHIDNNKVAFGNPCKEVRDR